jgi:3'-phosphoadenosine 5'-phosphosulfate sulfotransferase (PAPS reductase)/FAD synthetase
MTHPTLISFSGGRSSGMMAKILCDNLPENERILAFANTGKEEEATLKFVHDFEVYFAPIIWLEYCPENGFKVVDFQTASRNGEPYEALIKKRKYLPNVVARFCTTELKITPIKKFMKSLGFKNWDNAIGIRYDEPRRYARLKDACKKEPYDSIAPLYQMRIRKQDVLNFWKQQPFDLQLQEHEGNCDLCFLKSRAKIKKIIKENPTKAEWWSKMEKITGGTFNKNISYEQTLSLISSAPELFDSEIEFECFCNID